MIRQTLKQTQLNGKIVKSILEFDRDGKHELFILFSPGTTNGPSISRTGKGSPTMTNLIQVFADPTPDPDLQRFGNLVVDDEIRQNDLNKLNDKLMEESFESEYKNYIQTHLNDLRGVSISLSFISIWSPPTFLFAICNLTVRHRSNLHRVLNQAIE